VIIGKERLRLDDHGEDGQQVPDAHPTPLVEANYAQCFPDLVSLSLDVT
jgi:hypothetical protein